MLNKDILLKLRKKTKMSFTACLEALKKTNNNIILAEKILYKKKIKKSCILNCHKNIIYNYKKNSIILKIKIESIFIKNFLELIILLKKIIILLIRYRIKNIYKLNKKKLNKNCIKKNIEIIKSKIKENFKIKKFSIIKTINKVIVYNYEENISIIINYKTKTKYLTKNICLHIVWNRPVFLSLKSIRINILKKKYKYINIIKNIIKEKIINKLFKKYTLLNQVFIKNKNFNIKNILKIKKININYFLLYK